MILLWFFNRFFDYVQLLPRFCLRIVKTADQTSLQIVQKKRHDKSRVDQLY
jgi:hypothetical protein